MPELRLIDPNGHTVPGTVSDVPEADVAQVTARLKAEDAPQDASLWGLPLYGYRVQNTAS